MEIDRPLLLLAVDGMLRHGLSAYDTTYFALALIVDGRLLTLDRRLAEAAGARVWPSAGLGRISGAQAPYGASASSPLVDWARHGAFLAELRDATA